MPAVVWIAAVLPISARAAPDEGELRVLPVADGTVCQAQPDLALGAAPELEVRGTAEGLRLSYLRFEVPDVAGADWRLRLHALADALEGGTLFLAADDGWTEADLTWNRQPLQAVTRIAELGPVSAGAWIEVDLGAVVDGPGTYVLALAPAVDTRALYSSLQGTAPPELRPGEPRRNPYARFAATPSAARAPATVAFTDLSEGEITSWSWSFGDGTRSSLQNPVHLYAAPGDFQVRLTVTGPRGTSDSTVGLVCALPTPTRGLWIDPGRLALLPVEGPAWDALLAEANQPTGTPLLSDKADDTDVRVLAKALVYARTGVPAYRDQVVQGCLAAIGTEAGGETLALSRNLVSYVIAADLVVLPPAEDCVFRSWLRDVRTEDLGGRTLISTHEDRPNNWGTHAGASRAAVAVYLGDRPDLDRCAQVFRGWLGNRTSYAGFKYGDLSWQADPTRPVGINPPGAMRDGHSIDGVLPDDQRRSGGFVWPPPRANYVWEALQGALVQATILERAGYDAFVWQEQALLRAYRWLHDECDYPAEGDDTWQPFLVNFRYASSFPVDFPSQPGKNMGWSDWTHAGHKFDREPDH